MYICLFLFNRDIIIISKLEYNIHKLCSNVLALFSNDTTVTYICMAFAYVMKVMTY